MASVRAVRRTETEYRAGKPQIKILLDLDEARDLGLWLSGQTAGDPELGDELVKVATGLWLAQ